MFDAEILKRLLALHEKSYALFKWLNGSLSRGKRSLASVQSTLSFSEAASDWLRRNRAGLPDDLRPAETDLEDFAHLFVSYLATSFEVVDGTMVRACPGCCCCVYWLGNRHLRARNPDRKAKATAGKLKVLALRSLADEAELPFTDAELQAFVRERADLAASLSLFAYAHELFRRTRFASQGEAVLALWREVAWDPKGSPKRKFRLKADAILKAERTLRDGLDQLAG